MGRRQREAPVLSETARSSRRRRSDPRASSRWRAPAWPSPQWRSELAAGAEIAALCGLVAARPVLDAFGRSPDLVILRGVDGVRLVWFALLVTAVPWLTVWCGAALTRAFGARVRAWVQVVVVAALAGCFAIELVDGAVDLAPVFVVVVACALALVAGWARWRIGWFARWLRWAAIGPVLFVAAFLGWSPTSDLVRGDDAQAVLTRSTGAHPPIVMIVFDELPTASLLTADGRVDATLFPNFARLAGASTWFRDNTSNSNQTWDALPAMLTGRHPHGGGAPTARYHPENLFTLVGATYDVRAVESITKLCPPTVCRAGRRRPVGGLGNLIDDARDLVGRELTPGRDHRQATATLVDETVRGAAKDPTAFDGGGDFDFEADRAPARLTEFLDGLGPTPDRVHPFDFLHILLPHEPWQHYPSGLDYAVPDSGVGRVDGGDRWERSARATELGRQRHLLQLRWADALLGGALARLDRIGAFDSSVVVVTADHGISFRPGTAARALDAGRLDPATFPELLPTPLFVHRPGQRRGVVDRHDVQLVDVLPTVADLAGLAVPWRTDGRSAFGPDRADRVALVYKSTSGDFGPTVGAPVRFDQHAVARAAEQYATGRFLPARQGPGAIYRTGRHGALVGVPTARLATGATVQRRAVIDAPERFGAVDPATGRVPGLVTGALDGPLPGTDDAVVVVVDGRVAGVSALFTDRGRADSFAVIVPETFLTRGAHTVRVAVVDGPVSAPVLHALR